MLFFFLYPHTLCAQQPLPQPRNALSLELGKTGAIVQLNYDRQIVPQAWGVRFTAGSNFSPYLQLTTVGGGGYHLFGSGDHRFESGAELHFIRIQEGSDDQRSFSSIFIYPNEPGSFLFPHLNLGYRRHGRRTLFRAGIAPGWIKEAFVPGAYLSYGITF